MDETHSIPMDMFHANDYVQTLLKILEGQSTLGIDIDINKKKIYWCMHFLEGRKRRGSIILMGHTLPSFAYILCTLF